MTLMEFISWVLNSGGSIMAMSWIAERITWFQERDADTKEWLLFISASILACGMYAVQTYVPAETLALIDPWFKIVSMIFITVMVGKFFHKVDKN